MKNILKLTPLLIILFLVAFYNENITRFVIENFVYYNKNTEIINNEYALNYNYLYISSVTDFSVTDKKDLLNTLYTILNSGEEEFSFYCDYEACTSDLNTLINTNSLSTINNFVHPYNSYKKVYVTINSYNKVTISFIKTYSNDDIKNIETKIDEITNNIITDEMSNKEKIIAFHNYIIDNARYDSDYINNNLEELRFNWPAAKKVQDVSALSAIIMPTSLLFKQDGTTLMLFECVWDSDAGFAVQIYPDWEMGRQDLFL